MDAETEWLIKIAMGEQLICKRCKKTRGGTVNRILEKCLFGFLVYWAIRCAIGNALEIGTPTERLTLFIVFVINVILYSVSAVIADIIE